MDKEDIFAQIKVISTNLIIKMFFHDYPSILRGQISGYLDTCLPYYLWHELFGLGVFYIDYFCVGVETIHHSQWSWKWKHKFMEQNVGMLPQIKGLRWRCTDVFWDSNRFASVLPWKSKLFFFFFSSSIFQLSDISSESNNFSDQERHLLLCQYLTLSLISSVNWYLQWNQNLEWE